MNFHPILVHFPIALLTIYALMELIRFEKIKNQDFWFYTKAMLSIFGAISTLPAILTGKIIERQFRGVRNLVHTHSTWAQITTLIFAAIAAAYLIAFIDKNNLFGIYLKPPLASLWNLLKKFQKLVLGTPLSFILIING